MIEHSFSWKKLSVAAVIAYRWDRIRTRVYIDITEDSYDTEKLIQFLGQLKRHFRGQRVILIWDGLTAHKSGEMIDYLVQNRSWLTVERLPAYAPELNPVEQLWNNLKAKELANFSADNLSDLADAVLDGIDRVRSQRQLTFSFLEHAGLAL